MRRRSRGFTLIELVAAIVLLGVGAVAIVGMFGTVSRTLGSNQDIQVAAQLAQECGEYVLAARRNNTGIGYAGVTGGTFCSAALPATAGFTVTTNITDPYVAAGTCPGTCKLVSIVVAKSGDTLATSTLMLVDY